MGRREGDVRPGRGRRGGVVCTDVPGVPGSVSDLKAERREEGVEGREGEQVSGLRVEGEGERSAETTRDQRSFHMSSERRGPSGASLSEMR